MRILIVTDAWTPQVNGVVRTLSSTIQELERMGHEVKVIEPGGFPSIPCPTYPEIRLALAFGALPGPCRAPFLGGGHPEVHCKPGPHWIQRKNRPCQNASVM